MKIDYDKIYNFLADNEYMIKDVIDVGKVFLAAIFATTFDINIIPTNSSIDTWLKVIEVMIKIAVLTYTVYKIVEIHNRFTNEKKRWRKNP